MNRIMWPLGILLLVGSVVGAGWAFNQTPHPVDGDRKKHEPLPEVFCLGFVDAPDGVAELYPTQPGQVVEIAPAVARDKHGIERERVFKKGEVLLRLNSDVALNQLAKAKLALAAAEKQLTEAEKLAPKRNENIAILEAVIEAARHEKAKLEAGLEGKKKSYEENVGPAGKNILKAMEEAVAEADAKIRVEEGKLRLFKLDDPELKVAQAKIERDARKLDIKIAEESLNDFQIVAPFEGVILRVQAKVGEMLGPHPRVPAIEFCANSPRIVRTEVVQEWGDRVRVGQDTEILDDTYQGPRWQGRIKSLSPMYAQKRNRIIEPFMMNDMRTLECLVEFIGGQTPTRIGQRVRVKINVQPKS
jgi:multidrug resistance efflux pump